MLSEAELEEIRKGVREGIRGPILTKWCEQVLKDRDELARRLQAAQATHCEAVGSRDEPRGDRELWRSQGRVSG